MIWNRRELAAGLALLALAGCATTQAAAPPTVSPGSPGAPAAAVAPEELPPPTRTVLPNGLRLIVQDHRASDIVAVYLWVGVGVRYERPDQLGYAHFQEHMLFKGTDKWGPGYVDRAVEGVGGKSNAVTSFDYTTFYIVVPRESTDTAIELLHDMAFRSSFIPEEIAREREVIFEEARIEADNPRTAIVRQLYGMVFEGNPYGRPVLGIPETMNAATQERLRAFNRYYYTPSNMSLVVAGPSAGCPASPIPARPRPPRAPSPAWCGRMSSAPSNRRCSRWGGPRRAPMTPTASRWTCSPPSSPARSPAGSRAGSATRSDSSPASI